MAVKDFYQKLVNGVKSLSKAIDNHATSINEAAKKAEKTGIWSSVKRSLPKSQSSMINDYIKSLERAEKRIDDMWGNGKIPRKVLKLYEQDSITMMQNISRMAFKETSDWQERKTKIANKMGWSASPTGYFSNTFASTVLADIASHESSDTLSPAGFLNVGYYFIGKGPSSKYHTQYRGGENERYFEAFGFWMSKISPTKGVISGRASVGGDPSIRPYFDLTDAGAKKIKRAVIKSIEDVYRSENVDSKDEIKVDIR